MILISGISLVSPRFLFRTKFQANVTVIYETNMSECQIINEIVRINGNDIFMSLFYNIYTMVGPESTGVILCGIILRALYKNGLDLREINPKDIRDRPSRLLDFRKLKSERVEAHLSSSRL